VLTLRRLLLCFSILILSGVAQDAFAFRFGLNTGLYNESIVTPCARTREFGLRLGFYADHTVNDILYAQAVRGTNICGGPVGSPCGVPVVQQAPSCGCGQVAAPVPVGCSATYATPGAIPPPGCCSSAVAYAPAPSCGCSSLPPSCGASYAQPIQQVAAPATKTEIYLLVLPESVTRPNAGYQQAPQPAYYPQQPPMGDYQRQASQQGYYREPVEYQQPVRGLW
jgi:hypothetical protein